MVKFFRVSSRLVVAAKTNFLYRFAGSHLKPSLLVLEVTRRCNSRCVLCRTWESKPTKEFSLGELDAILSDSVFKDLKRVILTGGEPSLRRDLFQIIELLNRKVPNVDVWISTNGLLPYRIVEAVIQCKERGFKVGVGVSLDGLGAEHDRLRGVEGCFNSCLVLMDSLKELGIPFTIGFTLAPSTTGNYAALTEAFDEFPVLVQKYDCSSFYNTSGCPVDTNKERNVVLGLPDSSLKRHWLKMLNGKRRTFKCFALHKFLVLHCNGDVSPCLRDYNFICGNMIEEKPSDLWKRIGFERRCVKCCSPQCLNDWAFRESVKAEYFRLFWFKLKRVLNL